MHRRCSLALLLSLLTACACPAAPVAHMVFFTLAEPSEENREALIDACHQYLDDHEGTAYFSVGAIAEDLDREVNDRGFHVALHLVFDSRAAHDRYQEHPRHLKFIEVGKPLWSGVRVFDSYLALAKTPADEPADQ